jgi:hypothetical protein
VRAGNTTSARATDELAKPDEAKDFSVAYTRTSNPPKVKSNPFVEISDELNAAKVAGRVDVLLTISAEGTVLDARVVKGLHPLADTACSEHWLRKTRWQPAEVDGVPVAVNGVPQSCRFELPE